MDIIIWNFS